MLHLFKYRFMQTMRDFSVMFWALAFPPTRRKDARANALKKFFFITIVYMLFL